MADGGEHLPPNGELFGEQQDEAMEMGEEELQAYLAVQPLVNNQYHEDPHTSGAGDVAMEQGGYQMDEQPQQHRQNYYRQHEDNRSELFMPAEYVEPEHEDDEDAHFVMDQARGAIPPVNLEHTDATVWVDSDDDHDPEEHILKANFWLPYSDHNYDPPDPRDRKHHPCEGPFPIIDGLDEEGNIRNQWMPDGYGPPYRPGSEEARRAEAEAQAQQQQVGQHQSPQIPEHHHMQQQQPHPQQVLTQHHSQQLQYTQSPSIHQQHHAPMRAVRPTAATQPFSIGGNQVEYTDSPTQRPRHSVAPQQQQHAPAQFRVATASEIYNPQPTLRTSGQRGGQPIVRQGGAIYQSTQVPPSGSNSRLVSLPSARTAGPVTAIVQSQQQPTPGSYQHIGNPAPSGVVGNTVRRFPLGSRADSAGRIPSSVASPSILRHPQQGGPPGVATRPVANRLLEQQQADYDGPPAPHSAPLPTRRVAEVPPHRMTLEQQQVARQRAQGGVPIRASNSGVPQGATSRQQTVVPARGRLMGVAEGSTLQDQSQQQQQHLRSPQHIRSPPHIRSPQHLRSPQRVLQQPVNEQAHRKFQLKPLPGQQQQQEQHTYTIPVAKSNDNQLPAQLTEDPEEQQPVRRTSESLQKAPETTDAPGETPGRASEATEEPQADEQQQPIKQLHKSPARLQSASSSPAKQHGAGILQKPTPPHRLPQEERHAHFAKMSTEKERPPPLQVPPTSSSASGTPTHPGVAPGASPAHHLHQQQQQQQLPHPQALPQRHHQDDTLAVVQSVFESNKPRQPDTPKDKEAILKIADQLRISADSFNASGTSASADQHRHRTTSGGHHSRSHNYTQMHQMGGAQQHMQHQQNQMDQMAEDARRKRNLSGGAATRYDSPNLMNPLPDEPSRPRGRPRGSTVGPGARHWPDGQEPIAPHRAAGGARTLPPRSQAAPPAPPPSKRNGVAQKDSDSESDGVNGSESWEMRCHCGMQHGSGDTVECEECKTWQHMGCMGLTIDMDTSNYMCEQCRPRHLPVTKKEARKLQGEVLKALAQLKKEEDERAKKRSSRKSEPADSKKREQPSTSRKSAPTASQPAQPATTILQLNTYSKKAAELLLSMPQTAGADTLLEDSRRRARAKRMFVAEHVEALVTTDIVSIRQVVIEVNGHVSMANEVKRIPGGGNATFMYDGLMKGTTGEDVGERQELVCIDAKRKGNDSQNTRRSCQPNCVLKHVLGSQATLGIMVVATKDINRNVEVTLPFDADWKNCDVPLQCAEHTGKIDQCMFESERLRANMGKVRERQRREAERQKEEERHRIEQEVRRERDARMKQMEEQERLEREQKQKEKEEARKKREAEKKAAEQEKKKKEQETATSSDKAKKEDKKTKEKSPTPDSDEPSTSTRRSGRARKERNLEIAETVPTPAATPAVPAGSPADVKNGKRKATVSSTPARDSNTPAKRHRNSLDGEVVGKSASTPANRKRAAGASSTDAAGPSTKKKNKENFSLGNIKEAFKASRFDLSGSSGTMCDDDTHSGFMPGADITDSAGQSAWCNKLRTDFDKRCEKVVAERAAAAGGPSSSGSKKKEVTQSPVVQREGSSSSKRRLDAEKKKEEVPTKVADKKTSEKEKVVEKKKEEKKEEKKVASKAPEAAAGPAPPPARTPKATAPAPATPKSTPQAVKAPEDPRLSVKAPEVAAPKSVAPKANAPPQPSETGTSPSTDGSVEKELASTSSKAAPAAAAPKAKKLTMEDYKARRSQKGATGGASGGAATSGSSTPSSATPGPRLGFIPSTEGLKDVKLSAIPLDDHPAGKNTTTTTTAPSGPSSSATFTAPNNVVSSPSTRASRARGAPSESADDEPEAHKMSLSARVGFMFGDGPSAPSSSTATTNATTTTATSTPAIHGSRKSARPSRWNQ